MKPAAAVFDLFGTLLDIASLRDAAANVTDEPAAFVAAWRDKQIAYSFASAIMGTHEDFDTLTALALYHTAAKFGVVLDILRRKRLLDAWCTLPAYDDAAPALRALRSRGIPCVVLTDGTPATAASATANAGIDSLLDATLSVEAAGVFKPHPRVYALVTERFRVRPEAVLFVSSNGWDATGAATFGMRVAWCNRSALPAETFGPPPAWTIGGLGELATLVEDA